MLKERHDAEVVAAKKRQESTEAVLKRNKEVAKAELEHTLAEKKYKEDGQARAMEQRERKEAWEAKKKRDIQEEIAAEKEEKVRGGTNLSHGAGPDSAMLLRNAHSATPLTPRRPCVRCAGARGQGV